MGVGAGLYMYDVNVNEQFLSPHKSCNIVTTAAP